MIIQMSQVSASIGGQGPAAQDGEAADGETGQRGDTTITSYAGAIGPMQFMPATFRAYSLDGDGDGVKSITDLDDAVFSGANYLRAGGADKGRYHTALYNYNHSNVYVGKVLTIARRLGL